MAARTRIPLDPVAGAAALVVRVALGFLLIGAPLASIATRQAVYVVVPVGAALTLVGWLLDPTMQGPRLLRDALFSRAGLGVLFMMGWTALTLAWTPFSTGPSERFVKTSTTIALVGVAIAFMPARTRTSNLYLLPIGASIGALVMVAAASAGWRPPAPPYEYTVLDRAAFGLMLLFWPGVAGLLIRDKQTLAVSLTVLTVAAASAAGSMLALVALALSAGVFVLARRDPARAPRAVGYAWGAIILAAPFAAWLATAVLPAGPLATVALPVAVWGDIVSKDGIRTLIGHGFDSAARAVAAGYLPLQTPHSLLFELWFELGVVGAAAAAFVVARAARAAGAAPGLVAPCLLAGLVSALIASAFGVGIAPIWWITFLALDALAFALVLRGQPRQRRPTASDIVSMPPQSAASS